jgi:hypothetical protein
LLQNLSCHRHFVVDEPFDVIYVLDMKRLKRARFVPRPANAVPDDIAAKLLRISRMTLFRKLRDGTISPPVPVEGTQRRWWRPPDIEVAREQLGMVREERVS